MTEALTLEELKRRARKGAVPSPAVVPSPGGAPTLAQLKERAASATSQPQAQVDPLSLEGRGITSPVDTGVAEVLGEETVIKTRQAQSGFLNGLSDVLGFPVDVTSGLLNAAGIDAIPSDSFGGSKSIKDFFKFLGAPDDEAKTVADSIVQRTFKETGAAVPLVGALSTISKAKPFVYSLPPEAGNMRRLARSFVDRFRQAPLTAPAAELGTAASFGAGAESARQTAVEGFEMDPEGATVQAIDLAGGLVGGFSSGLAKTMVVGGIKGTKAAVVGATEEQVKEGVKARAGQILTESVPSAQRSIQAIDASPPGLRASTAQIVNEPGLVDLEVRLGRKDVGLAENLAQMRTDSNQTIHELMQPIAPRDIASGSVGRVIQGRVDRASEAFNNRIDALRQEGERVLAGTVDDVEASRWIRELLEVAEKENRNQIKFMFDNVDEDAVEQGATFITKHLRAVRVKHGKKGRPKTESPADSPDDILGAIGRLKKREPFSELKSIRSRISQAIRDEESLPSPNRNKLRKLYDIKEASSKDLDAIGEQTEFPSIARDYRAASQYMAQTAPTFREGIVAKQLRRGPNAPPASATLDAFFHPRKGAQESAEKLIAALGNRREAITAVRDYAIRKIWKEATNAHGDVDANRLRRVLDKYRVPLRYFPEARRELRSLEKVQQRIDALTLRRDRGLADVQKGAVGAFMVDDPQKAVRTIINSPHPEREAARIYRLVRSDPEAQEGLRRLFWDDLMVRSELDDVDRLGTPLLNPNKMRHFIDSQEKTLLAIGYSRTDIATLRSANEMAEVIARTRPPKDVDISSVLSRPRTLGEKVQRRITMPMIMSRIYAIQRGVVGPKFIASEVGSRVVRGFIDDMNQEQLMATLKEALVNPRFAKQLMEPVLESKLKTHLSKIRAFLFSRGILEAQDMRRDALGETP